MYNSFFVYTSIYSNSLRVSSIPVLIVGRISCINITSGISQLCRWPSSVHLHTWRSPTWLTFTRCHI